MTAHDPELETGLQVNLEILADGEALSVEAPVSVETWSAANRIPRARIVFYDGDPSTHEFPLSDGATLVPGTKIVVNAGYGSDAATIHTGVVLRHSLSIQPGEAPQLVIETADPLLKMTVARNSAVTADSTDSSLISALVSASGGSVARNDAATEQTEAIVQYNASDWDLMLLRAEGDGCLVFVEDSKVDVIDPSDPGTAVIVAEYGESIISFEATADASPEYGASAVTSRSWDYAKQQVAEAKGSSSLAPPGNFKPASLAEVLGVSSVPQVSAGSMTAARLKSWASARLMRARLALVRGSARFQGSALVKPGKAIELAGVGDRFNGTAMITAVRHVLRDGRWTTTAEFGMDPDDLASRREDVAAPPAAGLAAPMRGLHTGQVKQVATDPQGQFRVQVTMPLVSGEKGVWARLPQFYASSGFGAVFYPEVGDEVVLAFMEEDPASPVILGSLYSGARKPLDAYQPNEPNDKKAIVSRKLMEISFDDKDTILQIKTPGGRVATFDDKAKKLTVVDPWNSITMTEDQVEISAKNAMVLKAGTDMTIQAGGSITMKATPSCSISAQQVTVKAATALSLASDLTGELKAGASLTVKAPMVMIN